MLPNINNASKLTGNSSRLEILKALVDWIQKDEFAVGRKNKKTSSLNTIGVQCFQLPKAGTRE